MPVSRLTQQDMTDSEQRELKTRLDRARKNQGRTLTNAENNRIKKEYIDELMAARLLAEKKARQSKKKAAPIVDTSATFSWSAAPPSRGRR